MAVFQPVFLKKEKPIGAPRPKLAPTPPVEEPCMLMMTQDDAAAAVVGERVEYIDAVVLDISNVDANSLKDDAVEPLQHTQGVWWKIGDHLGRSIT